MTTRTRLARAVTTMGTAVVMALSTGHHVAHAADPVRIMIVGDSITQGSSGDVTWRYQLHQHLIRVGVSFDFVGDRLDLFNNITNQHGDFTYPYAFDPYHHAQWGRPLAYEKDTIAGAVASSGAKVVLVLLGINDLVWFGRSPAVVTEDMRAFVTNARAANPSVTIVIGHTMSRYDPWNRVYLDQSTTADLNARYDALAASMSTSGSRVVTTANPPGWDPAVHTWDGTHPNTTGETRIASAFAGGLNRVGIGGPYTGPTQGSWPWAGHLPTATPLNRAARLNWSATPGATGYLIEQRIVKPLGETAFTRLPYPISDTTWTTSGQAGWQIDYRIVPSKGLMNASAGPAVRALFGGVRPGAVTLNGAPGNTENTQRLWWSSQPEATGYFIEMNSLSQNPDAWTRLPYPVTGTSFDPGLLSPGHWYRWRVVAVNGLLEGPTSNPVDVRTRGLPLYANWYALGDSYSAGTGNQDSFGTPCLTSPGTWAHLAKAPWDPTPNLIACAGATVPDMRTLQIGLIPWHVRGPTLITMTVGGNDVGFADELTNCIFGTTSCTDRRQQLEQRVDGTYNALRLLYRDIRVRAPGADILVAGYPHLVRPFSPCPIAINARLSDDERLMIWRLGDRLNDVIQRAAADAGVSVFTPGVVARFDGHEACAAEPWINDMVISYIQSSFHPSPPGNLAYAFALNDTRVAIGNSGGTRSPV